MISEYNSAFMASFSSIMVSEIGDKVYLINKLVDFLYSSNYGNEVLKVDCVLWFICSSFYLDYAFLFIWLHITKDLAQSLHRSISMLIVFFIWS